MQKIILLIFSLAGICLSQTIYDVDPGTKGNQIKLTVVNISELNPAENVEVKLVKKPSSLNFHNEIKNIDLLNTNNETEASFIFDINRNAPLNKRDTVEFMISDVNGLMMIKSLIFNYIGPKEVKLEQNYPNPFNPTTTIQYQLPADASVTLKVYDILGSEVATLVNEEQEAGYKEIQFNGSNLASGMYIYRLTSGSFSSIKKMMIIK